MEVPDLVRNATGGETIEAGVNLGDEDTICLTPSRTVLYRAEGLLSDEKVKEFPHNVERFDVSEGRRKTKFVLEYVEGTRTFSVPSNRSQQVLELLMTGILREAGVIDDDESVTGVFRFSELALAITEARVVKHIGSDIWTSDYEEYPFEDLTNLSFEKGSVATEVVLEIDGRPKRIKTPNDRARKVQQVIENAVFQHHGVSSLEQLNAEIKQSQQGGSEGTDDSTGGRSTGESDIDIGDGIDPLVGGDDGGTDAGLSGRDERTTASKEQSAPNTSQSSAPDPTTSSNARTQSKNTSTEKAHRAASDEQSGTAGNETGDDLAAVEDQLSELTTVVQRQNELLENQQQTIKQLIKELREGRG